MKSKVKLSRLCIIVTIAVIVLLAVGITVSLDNEEKLLKLGAILTLIILFGLFYFPISIETSKKKLRIHRALKTKSIPYSEISSAERCYPSAGGLRLCASGGFMGYWGYFSDIIIGCYFGYYGNKDECILIKLKSGKQYVVSCSEPDKMIMSINEHI